MRKALLPIGSLLPMSYPMSAFPDWQKFAVHQRRQKTGCIPTAYEMMLKAAGAKGIDYSTFQDDFDLDKGGESPRNNFGSVGDEITKKYPQVKFACEVFPKGDGKRKLERLEQLVSQGKPVLVPITNEPKFGWGYGWHIMPVVDITNDKLVLLEYTEADGTNRVREIEKGDFVDFHDNYRGGDELAYLAES